MAVFVCFCFVHVVGNGHLALVCRFVVGCCVFAPVVMLFVICAIVGAVFFVKKSHPLLILLIIHEVVGCRVEVSPRQA